jgi:hypothetical protein
VQQNSEKVSGSSAIVHGKDDQQAPSACRRLLFLGQLRKEEASTTNTNSHHLLSRLTLPAPLYANLFHNQKTPTDSPTCSAVLICILW